MIWTAEDFAREVGAFRREMRGFLRRMVVNLATGGTWRMVGHALFDPTDREGRDVEIYPGIGFYARPPSGSTTAEAVVGQVGGSNNPAILATRDEATRKKVDDIDHDETAAFNGEARLYIKKDGSIEARTHGGVAVPLMLKSDGDALRTSFNTHTHLYLPGPGAAVVTAVPVPLAVPIVGTSKLKGE